MMANARIVPKRRQQKSACIGRWALAAPMLLGLLNPVAEFPTTN